MMWQKLLFGTDNTMAILSRYGAIRQNGGNHHRKFIGLVTNAAVVAALASSSSAGERPPSRGGRLRLRQVLVVHRHGDRTPITPMRDEEYWRATLPDPTVLEGIARGTSLLRPPGGGAANSHGAAGRGPFGQLTMMGLLQMVGLGERLRGELAGGHRDDEYDYGDDDGMAGLRLFTPEEPLHPSRVKVMSTDFPRTIQSVQALLAGLFPDHATGRDVDVDGAAPIVIDVRNTNAYFIPDPQPRQHAAQLDLERHLSDRPHLLEREGRLGALARRVTEALEGHLGEGAGGVSFGIGEEKRHGGGGGDDAGEGEAAAGGGGRGRRRRPATAAAAAARVGAALRGPRVPQLAGPAPAGAYRGGRRGGVGPRRVEVVREPRPPGPRQVGHVEIRERPGRGDEPEGERGRRRRRTTAGGGCRRGGRLGGGGGDAGRARTTQGGGADAVHLQRPRFHVDRAAVRPGTGAARRVA